MINPFFSTTLLPLFKQINIKLHAFEAMQISIDNQNKDLNNFLNNLKTNNDENKPISFNDIFNKLDIIQEPLSKTYGIISHLSSVDDSKEIREIKDKFRPELIDLGKRISQSKVLYDGINKIDTKDKFEKRVIDITLKSMEQGGVNLEEEIKSKLKNIDKSLSDLSSKFSENLLDATKSYKMEVSDISIMNNVPLWAKEMWNKDQPENGPWTITLGGPSIIASLKFIEDSQTRKELYMKYISRAGHENEDIINSIMKLRLEKSQLLGFNTYADLSLSIKMAENVDEILELLNDLQEIALPKAMIEYNEICEFSKNKGHIGDLEPWDITFWSERLKEEKFNMKEEELKPYFSLENVLDELFRIANTLFGVKIKQRTEDIETWHGDVRYFDVYENNGCYDKIIAGFYLDPYVREETKRGGAWMGSCVDKNKALGNDIPIAYLVCNGSPPSKDKPSLMSFSDVQTLFHEFGHGLQHMLTKIEIGDISGINSIEWDAVELPSQFMENWCYDKETLDRMAIHYLDDSKLPTEMYNSLIAQKNFGAAMGIMRQISFSKLDLYLHNNWVEIEKSGKTIWDIQNNIFTECTPYKKVLDEDKFLSTFSHIFGGYAAGYYSYKWAEVMSADCFEAFEEDPDNIDKIGRLFRDTVLSLGGSQPAMDTFVDFRGRKPKVDALLKHNGLLK